MYENLSEKRKQELDTLREWAVCAGDDYYFQWINPTLKRV